jgi:dolichol-phosphate mannosyltransferase
VTVSLSVLMPALNEAPNIEGAICGVLRTADRIGLDVEIVVLTCTDRNGQSDGTVDIVRRLANDDARVHSVHENRYQPLGEKVRHGAMLASKTHVVMIPGDNEVQPDSFAEAFEAIGREDVVLCYPVNPEVRPRHRRVLSRSYTAIVNWLFWRRLVYYNGMNIYRTADVQRALPRSDSFALGAEMVVRLLQPGMTYLEVPVRLQVRHGRSKALRLENVKRVIIDIARLRLRGGAD